MKKFNLTISWAMWISIASLVVSSYVTWDSMRLNRRINDYINEQPSAKSDFLTPDTAISSGTVYFAADSISKVQFDSVRPTLSGSPIVSSGTLTAKTSHTGEPSQPEPFYLGTNGVRVEMLSTSAEGIYHYRISIDTGITHLRLDGYARSSDVTIQFLHPDN